eukprot:PhF_6_TR40374/c0_g1_i2/m.60119
MTDLSSSGMHRSSLQQQQQRNNTLFYIIKWVRKGKETFRLQTSTVIPPIQTLLVWDLRMARVAFLTPDRQRVPTCLCVSVLPLEEEVVKFHRAIVCNSVST